MLRMDPKRKLQEETPRNRQVFGVFLLSERAKPVSFWVCWTTKNTKTTKTTKKKRKKHL